MGRATPRRTRPIRGAPRAGSGRGRARRLRRRARSGVVWAVSTALPGSPPRPGASRAEDGGKALLTANLQHASVRPWRSYWRLHTPAGSVPRLPETPCHVVLRRRRRAHPHLHHAARRATPAAGPPRAPAAAAPAGRHHTTHAHRRLAAVGLLLVIFVLLVLGVQCCRTAARDTALKDYNRDVSAVMTRTASERSPSRSSSCSTGRHAGRRPPGPRPTSCASSPRRRSRRARGFSVPGDLDQRAAGPAAGARPPRRGAREDRRPLPSALADGARQRARRPRRRSTRSPARCARSTPPTSSTPSACAPYIQEALADAGINGPVASPAELVPPGRPAGCERRRVAGALGAQRAGGGTGANADPRARPPRARAARASRSAARRCSPRRRSTASPASGQRRLQRHVPEPGRQRRVRRRRARSPSARLGSADRARRRSTRRREQPRRPSHVPLGQAPPIGTPMTITVEIAGPGREEHRQQQADLHGIFSR